MGVVGESEVGDVSIKKGSVSGTQEGTLIGSFLKSLWGEREVV